MRLHHREVCADTNPWAGPERQVEESVTRSHNLRSEIVWIEFIWTLPPQLMTVECVDGQEERVSGQDVSTAQRVGPTDIACKQSDWRIEAHCLLDYLFYIRRHLKVLSAGGRIAKSGTSLFARRGVCAS